MASNADSILAHLVALGFDASPAARRDRVQIDRFAQWSDADLQAAKGSWATSQTPAERIA